MILFFFLIIVAQIFSNESRELMKIQLQETKESFRRDKKSRWGLEEQRAHSAHLTLLLDKYLEVLIDDGDGEENSRSRPDSAHEVGQDGQSPDAETAERRSRRNVAERREE